MPVIKPRTHRVRTLRHISRLQEPNRDTLFAYARFIDESTDYVLNQLIDGTLAKDREFVAWRAEHPIAPTADDVSRSPQDADASRSTDVTP